MTAPRCIQPGDVSLVTKRTVQRTFLLRPDATGELQQIYWYVTAVIASELAIDFHAAQVMSNHLHEVVTDTLGKLSKFLQVRNRLLANAVKRLRGWPEEVFARESASVVKLYGADAIEREIGYTLANCVQAGLVDEPEDWPGATTTRETIGQGEIRVKRPDVYFDKTNERWPDEAVLRFTVPEALLEKYGSMSRARQALVDVVSDAVNQARVTAQQAGRVVGRVADLCQVPITTRATSCEPRRDRAPFFAACGAQDESRRARRERRYFLARYRDALLNLRANAPATFPFGTWRLCREFGAKAAPPYVASNRQTDTALTCGDVTDATRCRGNSRGVDVPLAPVVRRETLIFPSAVPSIHKPPNVFPPPVSEQVFQRAPS